jgi:hypothetical protein
VIVDLWQLVDAWYNQTVLKQECSEMDEARRKGVASVGCELASSANTTSVRLSLPTATRKSNALTTPF